MSNFVHLHVHTHYSLLDGMNRIDKLFEKVKANNMSSLAITDHGVMYGVPEFWKTAKDFSVKPIIGCEIYLSPKEHTLKQEVDGIRYYHLVILAKNLVGYKNLIKIVTKGHLEGMYYKPRVDLETLKQYSEGLICTSACLAGPIARHIELDQLEKSEDWLQKLHSIFKDDFYLEIQRNGIRCEDRIDETLLKEIPEIEYEKQFALLKLQAKVNNKLYDYSKKYNIPVITTTDAHYLNKDDKEVQKVLFCVKDGMEVTDRNARAGYIETYIKTPEEILEQFSDIPEVIENTLRVDEKIEEYSIAFDRIQPKFWNLPKEKTAKDLLREETLKGAIIKYNGITNDLQDRIDYELDVIHNKGYDDYFLVVSDMMRWAASQGILMGVRGSVAGSVVAHCLDIVEVEPIKWELYFERFLNPERPSPPDIDMDIQDDRRDEVINYVKEKYGHDAVAAIAALGRLKTKAAIRDVSRATGIDLKTADKLSKMVNVLFGKVYPIEKMMKEDPEFASIINGDAKLMEMKATVNQIENLSRHVSVHACGHLITPGPIVDYVPLQIESGGGDRVITQYEFGWLEELGLMKFDFLGLRTLTIVNTAIELIEKKHGVKIDFYNIPEDDKKTFELFSRGETIGVFQFESPPLQQYLKDLKPENQEDLCFLVAAYRPGPMKFIPDYIDRKYGRQEVKYLTPEMESIVGKTYGFAIYQEQVIKIAVDLAGYTMGSSDVLRRAMGKKKLDVMQKEEIKFKDGITSKGYSKDIAEKLWAYLLPFADYGFNKAHAAGYAVLAYKCAYLKAHYPLEFITALIHSDLDSTDRIVVDIKEARRLGYKILPPSVNHSDIEFTTQGEDTILFGLGGIKNVGTKLCDLIVKERQENGSYKHFDDFVKRVGVEHINKRACECLIKVGAMDEFGDRNALLKIMLEVFEKVSKNKRSEEIGQTDLFAVMSVSDDGTSTIDKTPFPIFAPVSDKEKMEWEKEYIGLFISTHPLQNFKWVTLLDNFINSTQVEKLVHQTNIKILGMFGNIKLVSTRADNKRMAVMNIEDLYGKCDAVIFPKNYEKLSKLNLIDESRAFIIEGTVNFREDRCSVIINNIEPANSLLRPKKIKINIIDLANEEELKELKGIFADDGDIDVEIIYGSESNPKFLLRKTKFDDEHHMDRLKKYIEWN
jgi:DNA polymerase-3 subunit alpha